MTSQFQKLHHLEHVWLVGFVAAVTHTLLFEHCPEMVISLFTKPFLKAGLVELHRERYSLYQLGTFSITKTKRQ